MVTYSLNCTGLKIQEYNVACTKRLLTIVENHDNGKKINSEYCSDDNCNPWLVVTWAVVSEYLNTPFIHICRGGTSIISTICLQIPVSKYLSSSALNKFPFKTDFLRIKSVFIDAGPAGLCCHETVEDAVSSLST